VRLVDIEGRTFLFGETLRRRPAGRKNRTNLGRHDRLQVDVNPQQTWRRLARHRAGDWRSPITALSDVTVYKSLMEAPPQSSASQLNPNTRRILEAIETVPDDEREVFDLVRIQGMRQPEAAEVLAVSVKTVQRRLNRGPMLLTEKLSDLQHAPESP
jgi:RNA polymerase sigma factor (sigma-70 family)